jgi:hypothetical protein
MHSSSSSSSSSALGSELTLLLLLLSHFRNKRVNMDTAVDVAIRPAEHKPDPAAKAWPADKQGFTLLSQADTANNWAKHQKQWVKHETTFTAPSATVGFTAAVCMGLECHSVSNTVWEGG